MHDAVDVDGQDAPTAKGAKASARPASESASKINVSSKPREKSLPLGCASGSMALPLGCASRPMALPLTSTSRSVASSISRRFHCCALRTTTAAARAPVVAILPQTFAVSVPSSLSHAAVSAIWWTPHAARRGRSLPRSPPRRLRAMTLVMTFR